MRFFTAALAAVLVLVPAVSEAKFSSFRSSPSFRSSSISRSFRSVPTVRPSTPAVKPSTPSVTPSAPAVTPTAPVTPPKVTTKPTYTYTPRSYSPAPVAPPASSSSMFDSLIGSFMGYWLADQLFGNDDDESKDKE